MVKRTDGPIYSDGSRISMLQLIGPIAVFLMVGQGIFMGQDLALLIALPLAFYVAFTWQTRYELFSDVLVVRYFWPRRMVIPIADVALVREAKVSLAGDGLLISQRGKGPIFIRPKNPSRLKELVEEHKSPPKQERSDDDPAPTRRRRPTRRPPGRYRGRR